MRKHKARRAAPKGVGRASNVARPSKGTFKTTSYPSEELKTLFTVTGKETIQGVHFDLRPAELLKKGYVPWALQYDWDPFYELGLKFPWAPKSSAQGNSSDDFVIREGDRIEV